MKIEPGCLAVIFKGFFSENIGRIVSVKEFDLEVSEFFGCRYWLVECPTPLRCKDGTSQNFVYVIESCLRPISGPSIVKHVRLWDELPREVTA